MRTWSCANKVATAPSVRTSCCFHFLPRKLTKPSTPVVTPFETSGAAAIEGVATRRLPVIWRWKAL